MDTFKLVVQTSPNCAELLKYIDKNISLINKLGVQLRIEKITNASSNSDVVEALRNRGVTRLPALLSSDGKQVIGLKKIIGLFEKNLEYTKKAPAMDIGTNPELGDFWKQELYSGIDRKNGKFVPRDDPDEAEDETADMEKKMAEYRRNVPKHRTGARNQNNDDARGDDSQPRKTNYDDNIAGSDDEYDGPSNAPVGKIHMSRSGDSTGDDLDRRMMDAWMNNNPQD